MRKGFLALPLLLLVPLAAEAQVPGSYQRSCTNISQNGPILSALCRSTNGQFYESSLNVARCGGGGVVNSRGRLVCGGYGGPRPPGFGPPPPRYDPDGGYPPPGFRPPPPRPRYYGADPDDGYPPPPPPLRYYPDPDQ